MTVTEGMTKVLELPFEETCKIIDSLELAEETGDIEALRWCARRIMWLCEEADLTSTDTYCYTENLFNAAWDEVLKYDPPPASVAAIIRPGDKAPEPPRIGNRGDALALLDGMIGDGNTALKALRKAIARDII